MLNPTELLIDACTDKLHEGYQRMYGTLTPNYSEIIGWAAQMALEHIANSDALYHNIEHTIQVTLVGQEILRGKHTREGGIMQDEWLHSIISLLCHDIGFVKGVCRDDRPEKGRFATGKNGEMVSLPVGASDASLNPYHVDRGKLFIEERFGKNKLINAAVIKQNIELTRFPVPSAEDHQDTQQSPGLVRAADLIGQLSDPRYLRKICALFYEFEELGLNKTMGYRTPGDLRTNYPKFYWNCVNNYIQPALGYLGLTQQGKQIIANLYAHVFVMEHQQTEA